LAIYGELVERVGDAARAMKSNGSHIFKRSWYEHVGSGDMRGEYVDGIYSAATAAGEALRVRGIANALLTATGGTINAIHATGRVAAGKTVSGALNGIRATLEVAGTTPTPGGTLAALQVDSNIVTGATMGTNDAFIRVTNSGATNLTNLLNLPAVSNGTVIAAHTAQTNTHSIKIVAGGTAYYIPCHATATGRS
jgi:hypothetical protein